MARLATSAAHLCQKLQDMYPQKLHLPHHHEHHEQSEQSSPFRRWTTSSGAGSSYRHQDHRNLYNKQMSEGTPPAVPAAASGGVSRWSLGLEQLLADPAGAAAFAHFLQREFAAENIRFWWSCEQYHTCTDDGDRRTLAQQIWSRHLAEGAPEPVNIDAAARRAAALLPGEQPRHDLFQPAQKQIFNVMKFDSYPRFLRSGVHAECARADLRGLPPPYAPRADAAANNTPSKLKKSASNASERRRSGGASLLPWKLRTVSKDRASSTCNLPGETVQEDYTDVVKSSTTAPGCSLCRVVLPDGATSVVGVDPDVPVRRLVDRLIQRRNLLCTSYDVLLKDNNQSSPRLVECSAPSSVLGGRSALVERRCVVRLELAGRCVAVRCRPQRRLRHALRPVLARYTNCDGGGEPTVLRDDVTVHMDTLMQELDGARLQVLLNPGSRRGSATETVALDRDGDSDSLSELAVRLHDDCDSQSGISASSRGSCGAAAGAAAGTAAGTARVRAALRPGAQLQQHPPEFLENLRETVRARLPRAPPPLPPKPAPSAQLLPPAQHQHQPPAQTHR